ncbi:MAG: SLATT domain-containing protein [Phenylobacterium sp.]|uniref:SLATT domain-containing protein n=1 Tax=Phenylobacterium sp. TaxID=1871053 RepID=UPI00272EEAAB|nr:SLATT domain-containing protein [Phenylobacterium sp.]MDP2011582.1 SLATT domain-containing protein [Phenylobacterium sp.]
MGSVVGGDVEAGSLEVYRAKQDGGEKVDTPIPIWRVHPLLGTMWKTKNSRFHAADRLRSRGWWKGIALSVLSAYVLVLSVAPKFIESNGGDVHRDYIGLAALTASIFILVFSIISIFDEDKLRCNYMLDNAKEIASIYHAYKLAIDVASKSGAPPPPSDTVNLEYQLLIEKCPFNHDAIDWLKTTIDIAEEDKIPVGWKKIRLVIWMFYDIYFWPLASIVITSILSGALFIKM